MEITFRRGPALKAYDFWKVLGFRPYQKSKSGNNSFELFPLHHLKTIVFRQCQAAVIMAFPKLPECITLSFQILLSQPFDFEAWSGNSADNRFRLLTIKFKTIQSIIGSFQP